MDMAAFGEKLVIYGGAATKVLNDIRVLDTVDFIWHLQQDDHDLPDLKGRFGHSCNAFDRYIVIFGGCGPYQTKLKSRAWFAETIAIDIQTGKYCKFDGTRSSLNQEIIEEKKKAKIELENSRAPMGSLEV